MTSRTEIRVRYAETDQMGVAHHSAYVPWLELARVDWLKEVGLDYAEIERGGVFFPVVELYLRYRRPAHFDEVLTVAARLSELGSRRFVMSYRVFRENELIAEARTTHVPQDAQGRARRLPDGIYEVLSRAVSNET